MSPTDVAQWAQILVSCGALAAIWRAGRISAELETAIKFLEKRLQRIEDTLSQMRQ